MQFNANTKRISNPPHSILLHMYTFFVIDAVLTDWLVGKRNFFLYLSYSNII